MQYAFNKKATFNYEVLDKYEGGLSLIGIEVKSIKLKRATLDGSYIIIRGGEAFLINASIPAFQEKNTPDKYDPLRPRKILLNKKELQKLSDTESNKGLTMIPISLYNKSNKIKLEFAVARGKKKIDKRQGIIKREADREIGRTLKKKQVTSLS